MPSLLNYSWRPRQARYRSQFRHPIRHRSFEVLEIRSLLAADLIISEFMASNNGALADEDGDFSDWLEIHNRGSEDVDLDGWYLTDNSGTLNKWSLPSDVISGGSFLLVWASGKNRSAPGAPLHTNFSLSADGEYLALSREVTLPGGGSAIEVVSEYVPGFPQQVQDISYGVGQNVTIAPLMRFGDPARIHFPTNNTLGTSWTAVGFNDASWQAASTAIGYESSVPGFTVHDAKSTGTLSNLSQALSVLAGNGVASQRTTLSPTVNFYESGGGGATGNYGDDDAFPNDSPGDDNDFAIRATGTIVIPTGGTWTFGINSDDGARLRVAGQNVIVDDTLHGPTNTFGQINLAAGTHDIELIFFERGGGAEVELFAARGSHTTFSANVFDLVGDTVNGGLEVYTVPSGAGGNTGNFAAYISTDVGAAMTGQATSVYLRAPFFVNRVTDYDSLSLRVQYDDGFVAYLNGVEVARRNAPAATSYNSTASSDRSDQTAALVENIDISERLGLLTAGVNVLAVHALNDSISSDEFLFTAELAEISVEENARVYFHAPTPGTFNSSAGVDGFLLDEIAFSHPHGFYDQSISVAISAATTGTTIRYTLDGTEPTESNGTLYSQPIPISATSTLRARAFKTGLDPSYVETATYLFIADILQQSANGAAPPGFPTSRNINGQVLDYGMDPDIVNHATWGPQLAAALTQVPSMSIVMDVDDLLNARTGIYTHPQNHGRAWERPISLELIHPDETTGFQINAGLRIRGGFSRSGDNPKHAFRLFFRNEYGAGKLNYPLFGDEGVDEFDGFDLRTTQNYSWSFQGSGQNTFLRDVFSRDVQRELGQPYTRSRFYHLYINGQYWGLFQTQERSEASFAASYFGGAPEDYDVIKSAGSSGGYQNEATDGNMLAYQRLANFFYQTGGLSDSRMNDYWRVQGMNPDGSRNPNYERLLDVDNLIDYMIITYYTGDRDGPATRFVNGLVNNYFAIFNRDNPDGFKFFEHDSEHSLDTGESNMVTPFSTGGANFTYFNPHWMHEQLANRNAEYRQRFSDRVYDVFFNDGVLTAANAQALLEARKAEFDQAIIAESARWGDAKRSMPFTKNDWQNAVNSTSAFVANRIPTVLQQFRNQGWYADAMPPQITVNGRPLSDGVVEPGDLIGMFAQAATVFEPIMPAESTWKYLADGSNQGTAWRQSGFNDANWSSGRAPLGYGDGDERTVVACGPTAPNCTSNRYITTYFRHTFTVANPDQYQVLRVRLQRDDGAAVYLNGQEVARSNLPPNATYNTLAITAIGGGDESTYHVFEIDASRLVAGQNVLAVEVHQQSPNSTDVSFDLALDGGVFQPGNSTIYYTLDGTDPRAPGGQPSATAVLYDGNPFSLPGTRVLSVRNLDAGQWSPLREVTLLADTPATAANLRISELNYHPHDALPEFGDLQIDAEEFEFVELVNTDDVAIDLTGVRFVQTLVNGQSDGIEFTFGSQTLAPGERLVVVSNRAAFASRYGNGIRLAESANGPLGMGVYSGSLRNSGEQVTLLDAQGNVIQQFTYSDSGDWPGRADGGASSLEARDLAGDYNDPANYRNSHEFGGSPGVAGEGRTPTVVINEIMTHTDLPQLDSIELLNTTGQPINVARWYISDGADDYLRYQISPATPVLAAGGYLVFDQNMLGFGFRGESSDDAWLIEADADGRPLRFTDHVEFGATDNGMSLGRWPNGSGDLFPMTMPTFAAANPGPRVGNVVLAELHYAPTEAPAGHVLSTQQREFIELWNHGSAPADISHWRVNRGVDFDIPAGTILPAQGRLVITSFDPVVDSARAAAFRQLYGIDTSVKLLGPWSGALNNGGETIELERPEDPLALGVGYVLVDRADYDNVAPWPQVVGSGQSIHRVEPAAYGNFATSWLGSATTPGTSGSLRVPGDFNGDGVVEFADIDQLCNAIRQGVNNLALDLNGDQLINSADLTVLIRDILKTSPGDANLDGRFNSTDLIAVFAAGEYEDNLAGNSRWASGDWNCDGEFNSADLIEAFAAGAYVAEAVQPSAAAESDSRSLNLALNLAAAAVDLLFDDESPSSRRSVKNAPRG